MALTGVGLLVGIGWWLRPSSLTEAQRIHSAQQYQAQGRLAEASGVLEPLIADAEASPEVRLLYGETLLARGELHLAQQVFSGLLDADTSVVARARYRLALTHFYQGHLNTAREEAHALEQWGRLHDDPNAVGQALHVRGRVAFNEAQYDSAEVWQRQSLTRAREASDRALEADALRQLGVLAWYRAQPDTARTTYYEPALTLYRDLGDYVGEATTLSNIGLLHSEWGDWETHIRYQLQAFGIRKRIGDQIGLADSYYFLSNLPHWSARQRRTFAYTYMQKSYDLSIQTGYAWGAEVAATALRNAMAEDPALVEQVAYWHGAVSQRSVEGRILAASFEAHAQAVAGNLEASAQQFGRLVAVIDSLGYDIGKAGFLAWQGRTLLEIGAFEAAEQALLRAQALTAGARGHRQQVFAHLGLARLYLKTERPEQAEAVLQPLVAYYDSLYVQKIGAENATVAFENAAASVHRVRAQLYSVLMEALARTNPARAMAVIERERVLPFWGERETMTAPADAVEVPDAFTDLLDLLTLYETDPARFDEIGPLLEALQQTSEALLEQQDLLTASSASAILPPVPAVATLQASLEPGEVLLEYFVGVETPPHAPSPVWAFVARRDTVALVALPTTEPEVNTLVEVYRKALLLGETMPNDKLWHGPAHSLYQKLLAPLEEDGLLPAKAPVVIAPHRMLHLLPFHALPVEPPGQTSSFLLEQHRVSYTPSAASLVRARQAAPRPLRSLLAAAPQEATLRYTQAELDAIPGDLFATATFLHGPQATAEAVRDASAQVDAVHLAAHAKMNLRHPLYSEVQYANRPLALHEILRQRLQARLVVLSACESGRSVGALGRVPSGEDLVSFPRAFMEAGASTVVASLWVVEDEATASLMAQFYHALSDAPSLAHALQHAQRHFLSEARRTRHKVHPFYWAGFYLIGDNR